MSIWKPSDLIFYCHTCRPSSRCQAGLRAQVVNFSRTPRSCRDVGQCAGARGCRAPSSCAVGATVSYLCLPVAASSVIKWSRRFSLNSERNMMSGWDSGWRCMWTRSAWLMGFVSGRVCFWLDVFWGEIIQWSLDHPGACGPAFWTGYLANSQSAAALCGTVLSATLEP